MKRNFFLAVVFLLSTFTFGSSLIFSQEVSAEPAQCFELASNTGDDATRIIDCNSDPIKTWLDIYGVTPADDTCYAVQPSGYGIYQPPQPIGSATCVAWREAGTETVNTPAKCILAQGASIADLANGIVEAADYQDVECNDALLENIRNAGNVLAGFEPGKCYVITAEGYNVVPSTCDTALLRAIGDAIAQGELGDAPIVSLNPDRDAIANCGVARDQATPEEKERIARECLEINPIVQWAYLAINVLSAIAAVAIVTGIIVGGIQYSTAGANPQAVGAAKGRIINALIALLSLTFLYSFLQWLIPGGIF